MRWIKKIFCPAGPCGYNRVAGYLGALNMSLAEDTISATAKAAADDPVEATVDYSRALRAIGQDLSHFFPRMLSIETDGTNFTARGQSHPNPFHRVRKPTFQSIWQKLTGEKAAIEAVGGEASGGDFQRTYTPADIDRLDQLYSANRTGQVEKPDNYSLAERLRALGRIVNSRNGRLQRLRKNADHLFADYWDQNGEIQTAKLTTVILYRNQQPLSGSPTPKELWEGYDF
jgi:hypothetical protein